MRTTTFRFFTPSPDADIVLIFTPILFVISASAPTWSAQKEIRKLADATTVTIAENSNATAVTYTVGVTKKERLIETACRMVYTIRRKCMANTVGVGRCRYINIRILHTVLIYDRISRFPSCVRRNCTITYTVGVTKKEDGSTFTADDIAALVKAGNQVKVDTVSHRSHM